ncbi:MAG: hypothetical protein EA405_02035 [Rhodospirillales bacterium]|nr:MAG: hypothetical protein EA405_02035 [Rhodospirillales bacterium]
MPFKLVFDLFLLRAWPYRHAIESAAATWYVSGFLFLVGSLYGLLVAAFQRAIGGELRGVPVDNVPDWILYGGNLLSGILIGVMVHAGIAIIAWLMAKGVGGPGMIGWVYKATAYLLPLGIPALPMLALSAAAATATAPLPAFPMEAAYLPLALLSLVLFLFGLFEVMRVTQGVGWKRAAGAVALFTVFCYAIFLIL